MPDFIKLVAKGGEFGGPMVPDYEAQDVGVRQYVGRRLDPDQGEEFMSTEEVMGAGGRIGTMQVKRRHAVFVPHEGEAAMVSKPMNGRHAGLYLRHLRDGDLLPGDEATAKWACVKFDPSFGGSTAGSLAPKSTQAPAKSKPPAGV
jgi:hypothetical protein